MQAQAQSYLERPPHGATSSDSFEVYTTTVGAASSASAAVLTSNGGIPLGGCYVTWVSDTDCYLRVGKGSVSAATSADWYLQAGRPAKFWHHDIEDPNFTVIQKSAGGNIKRYRSNL